MNTPEPTVVLNCPLGNTCSETKELESGLKVEHRCRWYVQLTGQNPQTGEMITPRFDCVEVWKVVLGVEGNMTLGQLSAGVTDTRNKNIQSMQYLSEALRTPLAAVANKKALEG